MEIAHLDNRPTSVNELSNQLIVLSNILARKSTNFNAFELKLFYAVLSKIKTRDEKNVVRLKKADICEILEIDQTHSSRLRKQFERVIKKSYVMFDGPTEEEWEDGFLLTGMSSKRNTIDVTLNHMFIPLLVELEAHFTTFYLEQISGFKSKYSILLLQNLKSWFNRTSMYTHHKYSLFEMKRMFELSDTDYMVKRVYKGKTKEVFDSYTFKKFTIDTAINEINSDSIKSGMQVLVTTIKHRGFIWGYEFEYTLIDKQGYIWDPEEHFKKEVVL